MKLELTRLATLARAVEKWGPAAQTDMMIEEMSELTKAILKLRRAKQGAEAAAAKANVREEMADVQIVLDQMKIMFGDCEAIEVEKLERLKRRLNESEGVETSEASVIMRVGEAVQMPDGGYMVKIHNPAKEVARE